MTPYPIAVASAAPIMPYAGIRTKFRPTFHAGADPGEQGVPVGLARQGRSSSEHGAKAIRADANQDQTDRLVGEVIARCDHLDDLTREQRERHRDECERDRHVCERSSPRTCFSSSRSSDHNLMMKGEYAVAKPNSIMGINEVTRFATAY